MKSVRIFIDIVYFTMIVFCMYCIFSAYCIPQTYDINPSWYKVAFLTPIAVSVLCVLFPFIVPMDISDSKETEGHIPAAAFSMMSLLLAIISSILNFNSNEGYIAAKLYSIPNVRQVINHYQIGLDNDCLHNQYSASCAKLNNYIYKIDKSVLGEDLYHKVHITENLAACFTNKHNDYDSAYKKLIDFVTKF